MAPLSTCTSACISRKTYGDFTLSSPLSSAMRAFVGKMNAALDGAFSPTVTFEEA
jgi:hypothetical protein